MPKINHRLKSAFLFLKKSPFSAFFIPPFLPKKIGGLLTTTLYLCMTNNANALMCVEGLVGDSCTTSVGTIGPLEPEHCALIDNGNNGYDIEVVRRCFGTARNKPTIAYRECSACTWGYVPRKVTTPLTGQNCGDLYYYECVKETNPKEVECLEMLGYVEETFTNQNGCARGTRTYIGTDWDGLLGPVEDCTGGCQSGYLEKTATVKIPGCTSATGTFTVTQCESGCNSNRDCPGWVVGGTDVSGKPGLKYNEKCEDGKCKPVYSCDPNNGYYNGNVVTTTGPTSCYRCPLYQNKYGTYGMAGEIRRMSNNTSLSGCYIVRGRELTGDEGTFEIVDEHCMY